MPVLDRAIRGTVSVPVVPPEALLGSERSIVEQVESGALDAFLAPLRALEAHGRNRAAVVQAIDARSRTVA